MIPNPPRTYAAAVDRLISGLAPAEGETLRAMPTEDLGRVHLGLALRLRNDYGLWKGNSDLPRCCAERAGHLVAGEVVVYDADGASNLIVRGAWEKLRADLDQG